MEQSIKFKIPHLKVQNNKRILRTKYQFLGFFFSILLLLIYYFKRISVYSNGFMQKLTSEKLKGVNILWLKQYWKNQKAGLVIMTL
jgi:hypothetical protein